MKRKITVFLVVGLAGLMVLQVWGQRQAAPVEFKRISERLYEIAGGSGANGGMYVGKYLVNTHSDGDHVIGNRLFSEEVVIIAQENCREEFFVSRGGGESEWTKPELAQFLPEITFKDKMDVYLGGKKVELWYFGVGHTTGDAVVYFSEEKVAFLGDQVFIGRVPLIHSYKGGNSLEQVKTLGKMLETLEAERFCSGHSEIIARADVQKQIDTMKARQDKVKQLMAAGKDLAEIQAEFEAGEARLVESIFNELKNF